MIDSYYTPSYLASRLLSYLESHTFKNVVDFCVGDGELIRAALNLWPNIECYGTDISASALRYVREKHPDWNLGKCDFLNDKSKRSCKVLKGKKNRFDLILLNPPFSCVGGTVHTISLDKKVFKASTAMKFLAESVKYLAHDGCLLAIMPISTYYSQKDKALWEYMTTHYKLSILEIPDGNFFKDCSPSIILVSVNVNIRTKTNKSILDFSCGFKDYKIYRGKISVHQANYDQEGLPFIHSTNINGNKLINANRKISAKSSIVKGPVILMPRVGKPDPQKIYYHKEDSQLVISDCIIAILPSSLKEGEKIYHKLIDNWDILKELYKGTGAKFITIERLDSFLSEPQRSIDDKVFATSLDFSERTMQTQLSNEKSEELFHPILVENCVVLCNEENKN